MSYKIEHSVYNSFVCNDVKVYMKYAFCIPYYNNIYLTAVHHHACFQSYTHQESIANVVPS